MSQQVIEDAVARLGADACLREAAAEAAWLGLQIERGLVVAVDLDLLAKRVARMELACDQIRVIAGSALVDLHKVEALAQLQRALR